MEQDTLKRRASYEKFETFKAELDAGSIPSDVICYIKETSQIYAKGHYYNCKEAFGDNTTLRSIEFLEDTTDSENLQIKDTDTVSQALAKVVKVIENNEKTSAAMGVDLNQRLGDPLPVNTVLYAPSTIGNPFGDKWLACDGSLIFALDYPDVLIPATGGFITLPTISEDNGLKAYIKVLK